MGSHAFLQGSFLTEQLNPGLHCREILYLLSHQGSPKDGNSHDLLKKMEVKRLAFDLKYTSPNKAANSKFRCVKNLKLDFDTCLGSSCPHLIRNYHTGGREFVLT